MLTLILHPHHERGGYHLERFDAYLGDQLVTVSRQPLYDGARALLDLGADPETLLTIWHHGKDDSFEPRPLGELAKWTISERDRRGLSRERWTSYPGGDAAGSPPVASPASDVPPAAPRGHPNLYRLCEPGPRGPASFATSVNFSSVLIV